MKDVLSLTSPICCFCTRWRHPRWPWGAAGKERSMSLTQYRWTLADNKAETLLPLSSSVRHPVLHLPLRQRWHGCDRNRFPQGAVSDNAPGVPAAAGPWEGCPQQDPGQADAQAGRQLLPILLRGDQSLTLSCFTVSTSRLTHWSVSSQFPDNLPCSVCLQPAPHDVGKVRPSCVSCLLLSVNPVGDNHASSVSSLCSNVQWNSRSKCLAPRARMQKCASGESAHLES